MSAVRVCPTCKGTGLYEPYTDRAVSPVYVICPTCAGARWIRDKK